MNILRRLVALTIALSTTTALGVAHSALPGTDPSAHPSYTPGRLIVRVSDALASHLRSPAGAPAPGAKSVMPAPSGLDELMQRHGARSVREVFADRRERAAALAARFPGRAARALQAAPTKPSPLDRIFMVELSPDLDMEAVATEYAAQPGVEWAEPDRIFEVQFTPNDSYFPTSGSWGQPFRDLWGLINIDAPSAWDVTHGAGVVVAVVDTGVDGAHPDIAAHMWTNPGEIAGNGVDDDGNGFVDDKNGWDFINHDNQPFDDQGHGTHCAGTIGAIGNNGVGITGIAFEASIMPVKALSAGGSGGTAGLADAVLYAADNGADVISASWGGVGHSQLLSAAVTAAHDAGTVFVAAAGNAAHDVYGFSPADEPDAITVAATDHNDVLAGFSNFGPKIDIAAPGGGDAGPPTETPGFSILSLRSSGSTFTSAWTVGNRYTRLAGTSMATPHVSGVAALVLAAHPTFTPEQVRQALRASADDVDSPGYDLRVGYGRLNAARAVQLSNVLEARITSPAAQAQVTALTTIVGTASGPGFESYILDYGLAPLPTTWHVIAGPVSTPVVSGDLGTWDLGVVPDGELVLRLRAFTTDGLVFEDRVPVGLDTTRLTSPMRGDIVGVGGAPLEIRGTAAGFGFYRYVLEYRVNPPPFHGTGDIISAGWLPMVVPGNGFTAVTDGVLGTYVGQGGPVTDGLDVDFRLTVTNTDGFSKQKQVDHVVYDRTLRPGWPRNFPLGRSGQRNVTLADLDGDDAREILLVSGYEVHALRGDGTELPGWPQTIGASPNRKPGGPPAVADMDGIAGPEVVTPVEVGFDIRHADGTLMTTVDAPGFYVPTDVTPTLADVDGDGQRDIIYVFDNALWVIRLDGTVLPDLPGFPVFPRCNFTVANPCVFETAIAVGDIDGDGHPEIAAVGDDNRGRQYLHVFGGDGLMRPHFPRKQSGRRIVDNLPIMADLDGDGRLDVAANDDKGKLAAYTAAGKKIKVHKGKLPGYEAKVFPYRFRSLEEPLSAGDLDGDGRNELFVGRSYPDNPIVGGQPYTLSPPYRGFDYVVGASRTLLPAGFFSAKLAFGQAIKTHGPGTVAIGDIDGNGQQDVVVGSGTCAFWGLATDPTLVRCFTVSAFHADGTSVTGFPKPTTTYGLDKATTPALGDLDGDGLNEVVWIDGNDNVLVWSVPGTPGAQQMQWPMFRHDPAHTGALPTGP